MRALILLVSRHHGNTRKVVDEVTPILGATVKAPGEVMPESLVEYDLIGFASGIYGWKMAKEILDFIERLPEGKGKRIFVLSTSGGPLLGAHEAVKSLLTRKGYTLAGEWNCRGWDTFGPLQLVNGISKGRPDERDFADARGWAEKVKAGQPT